MDKGFIAVEETVTSGKEITFEPALAHVLAQHFHHATVRGEVDIHWFNGRHPLFSSGLINCLETIRSGLVRPYQTEVSFLGILPDDIAEKSAQHTSGLSLSSSRFFDLHRIFAEVWHGERLKQQPAIGVRIHAHAPASGWGHRRQVGFQLSMAVE